MPVLQSDIDALTEALATGERLVRKGDKTIEYRSVAEIKAARDLLIAEKAAEDAVTTGQTRPKQTRLYHGGRGY
jgi:hypothetical protein